ncbi:HAD-IA family hydrolase [Eggerthellaceae bacterium zg-997]|nr:HAD-IA family hydrolase [Eggerthellaceae bacterium zg-997]
MSEAGLGYEAHGRALPGWTAEQAGGALTLRAALFDVGGTLIAPNPDIGVMLVRTAAGEGVAVDSARAREAQVRAYALYDRALAVEGDFWCDQGRAEGLWLSMYELMCDHVGLGHLRDVIPARMYATYLRPDAWRVLDGAFECLQALRDRGVRLGVVSNWAVTLPNLLEGLGLARFFDVVVASAAVGARKPDPVIFQRALDALDARASETVHVGDSWEADAMGARAAGLRAVLVGGAAASVGEAGASLGDIVCVPALAQAARVLQA